MMKLHLTLLCLVCLCGCTSSKSSTTARTATEQLLISNAVDEALSHVNLSPFAGKKVFLEEKYMDSVDKNYIVASLRHRLLIQGAHLIDKKEDSEVTIELRSGGVGTDMSDTYVGVPEVTIPGMVAIPEVRLITKDSQSAAAKIGMVAYETDTGRVVGHGGTSLAEADRNNWFVMGVGPYQNGTLKEEKHRAKTVASQVGELNVPNYVTFRDSRTPYDDEEAARIRLTSEEQGSE